MKCGSVGAQVEAHAADTDHQLTLRTLRRAARESGPGMNFASFARSTDQGPNAHDAEKKLLQGNLARRSHLMETPEKNQKEKKTAQSGEREKTEQGKLKDRVNPGCQEAPGRRTREQSATVDDVEI